MMFTAFSEKPNAYIAAAPPTPWVLKCAAAAVLTAFGMLMLLNEGSPHGGLSMST